MATNTDDAPAVETFLSDGSHIASASRSFHNDGFLDQEYGFSRSDFRQSLLVGTVEYYQRHVFLCYKQPQVWPPRIEAAEFDRLPRLLSAALAARKGDMKRKTRLTICEGHDGAETSNGDVLIFPDMIRYRRLTHFDIDIFVEEVLVKDGEWLPGSPEALRGSYIFVCAHGSRDWKCGICGPAVIARFKDEIELRGYQHKVSVRSCSHIGGHEYAGNVIIYGSNNHGKVTGHWYGYVLPDDVPTLLEHHIEKGKIVDFLWRGQMDLSEEDQKKALKPRIMANGGSNIENNTKARTALTDEARDHAVGSQVEPTGCCQANRASASCHSPISPENSVDFNLDTEFNLEKRKGNNNNKATSTACKACSTPTWHESWEKEDIYAALALIGAAVSVAVAYNCYRQMG